MDTKWKRYTSIILFSALSTSVIAAETTKNKAKDIDEFSNISKSKRRSLAPHFFQKSIKDISIKEYPLASIHDAKLDEQGNPTDKSQINKMQILNNGLAALQKRIELIEKAQEEILLEYFIFEPKEYSTQLILKKLIEKAENGVKVKILLDKSFSVFAFDELYVQAILTHLGIKQKTRAQRRKITSNFEVRYYNANPFWGVSTMNFRNHRKLLAIDGNKEAITGGRNIEDKYFDLDRSYNFHDRDIWVSGPVVKTMTDSFHMFWNHDIVQKYQWPKSVKKFKIFDDKEATVKRNKKYNKWLKEEVLNSKRVDKLYEDLKIIGNENLEKTEVRECMKTTFVTDRPGGNFWKRMDVYGSNDLINLWGGDEDFKEKYIITERALGEFIYKANEKITIISPYFLLNQRASAVKDYLLKNKIQVNVFTNSLNSTDAFYVASRFYSDAFAWSDSGLKIYVHGSKFIENEMGVTDDKVKEATWGLHSKTQVYDDDKFYVGTYNVDNRSAFYNTEMGLFCEGNKELVSDILEDVDNKSRVHGLVITGKNSAEDVNGNSVDIYAGAEKDEVKKIKFLEGVLQPFEFLM